MAWPGAWIYLHDVEEPITIASSYDTTRTPAWQFGNVSELPPVPITGQIWPRGNP